MKYTVTIGSDSFEVEAKDNQEARYDASKQFKEKYKLEASALDISNFASTRLMLEKFSYTTEELIKILTKES